MSFIFRDILEYDVLNIKEPKEPFFSMLPNVNRNIEKVPGWTTSMTLPTSALLLLSQINFWL